MKLPKSMLCVLLTLICATGIAQKTDSRQKLFAAYPQDLAFERSVITQTFSYPEGATVTIPFSPAFHFTGLVISNQIKFDNLQMVLVKSSESSTVFQLNKITNKDNTISYTGRTFNNESGDGYEIKNNDGIYTLHKFETMKILEPCRQ